jgi:hypothetical protein
MFYKKTGRRARKSKEYRLKMYIKHLLPISNVNVACKCDKFDKGIFKTFMETKMCVIIIKKENIQSVLMYHINKTIRSN